MSDAPDFGEGAGLAVDEAQIARFTESVARLSAALSPAERAVLTSALNDLADPWTRSLDAPPSLTEEEQAVLAGLLKPGGP